MWLIFAFLSAFLLGCNDALNKVALTRNALIPVIFLNSLLSSLMLIPFLFISCYSPDLLHESLFFVPKIDLQAHLLILVKSGMVLLSWILIDSALKHLPLTIIAPVKASQPIFVVLGAMTIFTERLNTYQWVGIAFAVLSFFLLSRSGQQEGIYFKQNKWIICIVFGVIANAVCGLYDKFMLSRFDRMAIMVWYNLYLSLLLGIFFIVWYFFFKVRKFVWHWQILLVSLFICLSDFTYFYALGFEGSMISTVSMIRRSGIVVSFLLGAIFFHERNLKKKAGGLLLMLIGMFFLYIGSHLTK